MLPTEIKNLLNVTRCEAASQQHQLVSHWKDMSSLQQSSKKRRRTPDCQQPATKITKTHVQTQAVAQINATVFGTRETREMPAEPH